MKITLLTLSFSLLIGCASNFNDNKTANPPSIYTPHSNVLSIDMPIVVDNTVKEYIPTSFCCNSSPIKEHNFVGWQGPELFWIKKDNFTGCPHGTTIHLGNDWSEFSDSDIYKPPFSDNVFKGKKIIRCSPWKNFKTVYNFGFLNCVWSNKENKICPSEYFEYRRILE